MNKYNEDFRTTTLENGLVLITIRKQNYKKSHVLYMTNFGALKNKEYDELGNLYEFKSGLAHFLEHKMFEAKDGSDYMDRFSKLGICPNAFTTYSDTCYYFTTSFDLYEPLSILMEMVEQLDVDAASVEKEKGIIIQEYLMYQQEPDVCFSQEIFKSLFPNHPLKDDVVGDEESINSITVEDLYECFDLNYNPANMALVVVSGEEHDKIIEFVKEREKSNISKPKHSLKSFEYDESVPIRPYYEFKMDVYNERYAIAYKLDGIKNLKERYVTDLTLKILLEMYFSSTNHYLQDMLEERLINDSFIYDSELGCDYGYLLLAGESEKIPELKIKIQEVLNAMLNETLDEMIFESIKRRILGNNIRLLNSFDDYAYAMGRANCLGLDFFESIELVQGIQIDDLYSLRSKIDLSRVVEVKLLKSN